MTGVLVVDDQALLRTAFSSLIDAENDFEVVGGVRVLILTTFDLDEYVFEALRAGASGFALKSRPLDELLNAIRIVAAGEALLAPSVTRRLMRTTRARPDRRPERQPAWRSSPNASVRCWRWSPRGCPTRSSPGRCM